MTEAEIQAGILTAEDVNSHCVWFKRVIPEIEDKDRSDLLAKYIGELHSKDIAVALYSSQTVTELKLPICHCYDHSYV